MDAIQAITTRQSIPVLKSDPVPRDLIEQILTAAVQAPNHHRVRPWRFVVLMGEARRRLGEVMAQSKKKDNPDGPEAVLDVERAKPLRAPVLIAVGVEKPLDPKVIEIENVCAVAAAAENLLLAAHALGLGGMWRTGPAAYDQEVKAHLGFASDQHIIAFLYIGYPEGEPKPKQRLSYEDRTIWRGE